MSTVDNNSLPAPCQRAWALRLQGAENAAERQELGGHLASCTACAELVRTEQALQQSFIAARVTQGFAARVMAQLPDQTIAAQQARNSARLRIYGTPQGRRRFLNRARMAAVLAVAALLGLVTAAVLTLSRPAYAVTVLKGVVTDAAGKEIFGLLPATHYTVKETVILPLGEKALAKVQEGTQFRLQPIEGTDQHRLELVGGDLYAATPAAPVQVSCAHFDTELACGDMFVAQENTDVVRSIVIVFDGAAQVRTQQSSVALVAGQMFFCVGREGWTSSDVAALDDLPRLKMDREKNAGADITTLRHEYSTRVEGYQRELAALEVRLAEAPLESVDRADLSDRRKRMAGYLDEHRRRLNELSPAREYLPLEKIESGIEGHTNPINWL